MYDNFTFIIRIPKDCVSKDLVTLPELWSLLETSGDIYRGQVSKNTKRQLCLKLFLLIITIIYRMSRCRHLEKTHGTIQNNNALRFL